MAEAKEKKMKGKMFVRLAGIIAISMVIFNGIETTFVVENTKNQVRTLNTERYEEMAQDYTRGIARIFDEYFAYLAYYINADVVQTKDTEQIVDWLHSVESKRFRGFDYVAWVNTDGEFYSDIGTKTVIEDRDYYKAIVRDGADYFIDNPVSSKVTGKTIIHISKAVKVDGQTIGFFCGVVNLSRLTTLLDDVKVENIGISILYANDGQVIAKSGAADMMDRAIIFRNGEVGSFWSELNGIGGVLNIYTPIDYTNWTMVMILKESVVISIAKQICNYMINFSVMLAIVVIGTVAISVYKSINPLKTVEVTIRDIATGNADLTKRVNVKSRNEIGRVVQSFNQFTEKLQSIISSIKETKDQLILAGNELNNSTADTASAISQIIANIENLSSNINLQGDSVSETAGAVNEIASNIESLNKMIETQASAVVQASASVEEMIGNISSVSNSVEKMAGQFTQLQEKALIGLQKQDDVSAKIEIIESESEALQEANSVIANIAEQTNLLAMNAAIEAAHAGEAGRGFSVVADEIRKLSETSSAQSSSIGNQLNKILESINQMVGATDEARQSFSALNVGIEETSNLVQEITGSMQEQMAGSRQISDALNAMNSSTSEVKTSSYEMSEGNKAILSEIKKLQEATYNMKAGMEEMAAGAKQINETGNNLSEISQKMETSISLIGEQVDLFRV